MMRSFILSLLLLPMTISASDAQDLVSHQWNDRLVVILANNTSNALYRKQLSELLREEAGLKERKIVVYQVLPEQYRAGLQEADDWQSSGELYSRYKEASSPFEILLIGLDGNIKLRSSRFLTHEELFETIDQMPMRRQEMKREGGS